MDKIEQNKLVYNRIAKHFSASRSNTTDELKHLVQGVMPGDAILDIGCGNGRLYQCFVEDGREGQITYTGVDFSRELLEEARRRFPGISFCEANMLALPLPGGAFDRVFCIAAFHHLPTVDDRLRVLSEVKRVLKPGGTFVMTNWHLLSQWAQEKVDSGDWHQGEKPGEYIIPWKNADGKKIGDRFYYSFPTKELEGWCEQVGLEVEEHYFTNKKGRTDERDGMNIVTRIRKIEA